jgi:polysaccharide pyruvyl transferase WcaK-like protein
MPTGYQRVPADIDKASVSRDRGVDGKRPVFSQRAPSGSGRDPEKPEGNPAGGSDRPPRLLSPGLRVRLFNTKYGPGLGEGLQAECLEHALIALGANSDTRSIDLAARDAYGEAVSSRPHLFSARGLIPDVVRPYVVRLPFELQARRKWRPYYAEGLAEANAVVIGGGDVISEHEPDIPTKLAIAIEEIERRGLPFIVYGAGVTNNWTKHASSVLSKAFSSRLLKGVYVCDQPSKLLWDRELGPSSGREATVVADPTLLASFFIPPARQNKVAPKVAGVGITSPIAYRDHGDVSSSRDDMEDWYVGLVRALLARNFHVVVFTDGSPEDVSYLDKVRPRLEAVGGNISFPTAREPVQLCAIVSALNVLIASRPHLAIASYSYRVPAVGLARNAKLRSFMTSVGREDYLCDVRTTDPGSAADLAYRAMAVGIADDRHVEILGNARAAVAQLLDHLERVS